MKIDLKRKIDSLEELDRDEKRLLNIIFAAPACVSTVLFLVSPFLP